MIYVAICAVACWFVWAYNTINDDEDDYGI